jgi:peroxin-6
VAEKLPFTYTGADFYALCSDAMLKAVTRQASLVDAKIRALNAARDQNQQQAITTAYFFDHHATPEDVAVMVTEQDFIDAHEELIPSVSAGELAHYERVRATFEGARDGNNNNGNAKQTVGRGMGKRTVSGASRGSAKGKGKAVNGSSHKGKGKAVALTSDDECDEDWPGGDSESGANGSGGAGHSSSARDKGKGVVAPFYEGGASDDEGLYE